MRDEGHVVPNVRASLLLKILRAEPAAVVDPGSESDQGA
jgi:hypothetical protein